MRRSTRPPSYPTASASTAAPGAGGGWDPFRQQFDTDRFRQQDQFLSPRPNNYEIGDGLNTAGFRFLRHFRGLDNLFGSGEATGERKQYNVKVDHNFTSNHKANVNVTYERVDSDDVAEYLKALWLIPGMFSKPELPPADRSFGRIHLDAVLDAVQ